MSIAVKISAKSGNKSAEIKDKNLYDISPGTYTVEVAGAPDKAKVNFFDFSTATARPLATDTDAPYTYDLVIRAGDKITFGIEVRVPDETDPKGKKYKTIYVSKPVIRGKAATPTPPVKDSDPVPVPPKQTTPPVVVPPTPVQAKRIVYGTCEAKSIHPQADIRSKRWKGVVKAWEAFARAGIVGQREWWSLDGKPEDNQPDWERMRTYIKAGMINASLVLSWKMADLPTVKGMQEQVEECVDCVPMDIRPYIESWEVGNEPAYGHYWREVAGNKKRSVTQCLQNYVELFLNPAYDVLHAAGYTVSTAGLNGEFGTHYAIIRAAGGKHDRINIHPYCRSVDELKRKYLGVHAANVNPVKPIEEGESNVYLGEDFKEWLYDHDKGKPALEIVTEQQNQHLAKLAMPNTPSPCYYFMATQQFATNSGPLGLFKKANDGVYDASPFYEDFLWPLANPALAG